MAAAPSAQGRAMMAGVAAGSRGLSASSVTRSNFSQVSREVGAEVDDELDIPTFLRRGIVGQS